MSHIRIEIGSNVHECDIPQSWNDLQLNSLYACYTTIQSDAPLWLQAHEVVPAKRLLLLQHFLGLSADNIATWQEDCRQAYGEDGDLVFFEEVGELMSSIDNFFEVIPESENQPERWQIRLGLTRCPYPELKHNEFIWYGPVDGLENLTIYELGTVFTLFEQYISDQDEAAALRLIATIYRPAKKPSQKNIESDYHGDIRLPYQHHERTVEKRLPFVSQLPVETRQLILFWIASCYKEIIASNPAVFDSGQDDPNAIAGERVGNDYGWAAIIMSLAGDLTKIDEVAGKSWSNVFTYLSFLEDERRRHEMRMQASRRSTSE